MSKSNYTLELRSAETLQAGMTLATDFFKIESSQLFMFSAITWNRHRIHYDKTQAIKEGHSDVLVQRGLIGNLFTHFIQNLFNNIFIQQLDWKVISSATPEDNLSCNGEITDVEDIDDNITVTLSLNICNQEQQLISKASAIIRNITNVDLIRPR